MYVLLAGKQNQPRWDWELDTSVSGNQCMYYFIICIYITNTV